MRRTFIQLTGMTPADHRRWAAERRLQTGQRDFSRRRKLQRRKR